MGINSVSNLLIRKLLISSLLICKQPVHDVISSLLMMSLHEHRIFTTSNKLLHIEGSSPMAFWLLTEACWQSTNNKTSLEYMTILWWHKSMRIFEAVAEIWCQIWISTGILWHERTSDAAHQISAISLFNLHSLDLWEYFRANGSGKFDCWSYFGLQSATIIPVWSWWSTKIGARFIKMEASANDHQ